MINDEHESAIQDTEIHKVEITEEQKQAALDQVKAMIKGNQYDPEDVKLIKFEGEVLHFQAENMLTIFEKITEKEVPGRVQGPVKVEGETHAKQEMHKAYLTLSTDRDVEKKIRDSIIKRDDKGFAFHDQFIEFSFWRKEFVEFKPCHYCNSTGKVQCQPCRGKGQTHCPRCHGSGMDTCSHCRGMQMVMGQNNQKVQCMVCNGTGKTGCNSCNHSGTIKCPTCRSRGFTTCPSCSGNAVTSHIYIMELKARTRFDYPRARLPERVVAIIEEKGAKLAEDAEITVSDAEVSIVNIEDEEKAKLQETEDKKKLHRIPIIYDVVLPYGHAEYEIKGQSYYTFMFGTKTKLIHVSPFLDDLIKNGVRKLHDASELRGDVEDNLIQAAKYRTVREGIFYAATASFGRAQKLLKQRNSLGLSDDTITDIIKQSDIALKHITKKPRQLGLGVAAIVNCALLLIYILTPVRDALTSLAPNYNAIIGIDLIALALFFYISMLSIQMTAQSAVQKTLQKVTQSKKASAATPKLGETLTHHAGISLACYIAIFEILRQLSLNPISWYVSLFG